jgi:hypothetical protein
MNWTFFTGFVAGYVSCFIMIRVVRRIDAALLEDATNDE